MVAAAMCLIGALTEWNGILAAELRVGNIETASGRSYEIATEWIGSDVIVELGPSTDLGATA